MISLYKATVPAETLSAIAHSLLVGKPLHKACHKTHMVFGLFKKHSILFNVLALVITADARADAGPTSGVIKPSARREFRRRWMEKK